MTQHQMLLAMGGPVPAPVVDASSSASTNGTKATSLTWSHTCSGSNRALIVSVHFDNEALYGVDAVTYNAVQMTQVAVFAIGNLQIQLWQMVAPDSGAHNVVVSFSGSVTAQGGAASFTGARQSVGTLTSPAADASGTSTAPSVNVTSAFDEIVMDAVTIADTNFASVGGGQTSRWERGPNEGDAGLIPNGAGSTEPGVAGSVTMSWTLGASKNWVSTGVSVRPILPPGLQVEAATSFFNFNSSTATFEHICTAQSNRALIVGVSFDNSLGQTLNTVTYNGVSLSFIGGQTLSGLRSEQWKLSAPASGAHNVVATWSAAVMAMVGAVSFQGAHQTTASLTGTQATATGTNTPATVNVSSANGEIVIDTVAINDSTDDIYTVGANQIQQWNGRFNGPYGLGSTELGATTVTMSWSYTNSSGTGWSTSGVSVKPP